jgi:TonB family protein
MPRLLLLLAMIVAVAAVSAAEDSPLAYVIDSASDRVPLQTVAPKYPREARRDRVEGQVEVCFKINRSGRPQRIAVRRSSNRVFERPSVKAVRASTFRALQHGEELQPIKYCRTFIFSLQPIEGEVH